MTNPNQKTEVTTTISPLLDLVFTKVEDGEFFTVRVEKPTEGDAPFETYEDTKGNQVSADFHMKRETAIGLAAQILRHAGLEFGYQWEAKMLLERMPPPPISPPPLGYPEENKKCGAV